MYNILICDDQKDIVNALKIYLAPEGYRLYEADNGLDALKIVQEQDIHLVLLDVMMPRMDGITATAKIREFSNVPIILLTAKSETEDKVLGLNVGADDYVTKPFVPVEVLARVRSQLRRYDRLELLRERPAPVGGILEQLLELPELGLRVTCAPAEALENGPDTFTVCPRGPIRVRFRETGDQIRLPGGTRSLKKLFIDRKIPAHDRDRIPVLVDDEGILAVHGIGPDARRKAAALPAVTVRISPLGE